MYSKNSQYNDLKYNIQIMKDADMPDIEKGNFILASHNGNSSVSYFDNLRKLSGGDEIFVYYKGLKYVYRLVNVYEIPKNGKAELRNDENKTTITLITCKNGDKKKQVIYVGELISKEKW